MSTYDLTVGDSLAVLAELEPASVDAIVTDPPYGLEFMGNDWDRFRVDDRHVPGYSAPPSMLAFQNWVREWALGAVRALKPGGYLLAFGGTRTYHRLAAGLEDAGLEVRDTLAWLYGNGFPKSLNLTGDHAGRGTALKPAYEPVVVARAPLAGTVAATVLEHGTGALNIDACRIGAGDGGDRDGEPSASRRYTANGATDFAPTPGPRGGDALGRWPANVALDDTAAALLDEQAPNTGGGGFNGTGGAFGQGAIYGDTPTSEGTRDTGRIDANGGASRFFYCAKADGPERNAGLDGFDAAEVLRYSERGQGPLPQQTPAVPRIERNVHPTVKPIDLMRWLVRLVTPTGGLVVDPFTGSGTTGIAAILEDYRFHGIERDPNYAAIARARIQWWAEHPTAATDVDAAATADAARRKRADAGQATLFG